MSKKTQVQLFCSGLFVCALNVSATAGTVIWWLVWPITALWCLSLPLSGAWIFWVDGVIRTQAQGRMQV